MVFQRQCRMCWWYYKSCYNEGQDRDCIAKFLQESELIEYISMFIYVFMSKSISISIYIYSHIYIYMSRYREIHCKKIFHVITEAAESHNLLSTSWRQARVCGVAPVQGQRPENQAPQGMSSSQSSEDQSSNLNTFRQREQLLFYSGFTTDWIRR